MPEARRAVEVARNVVLLGGIAVRHAADDPLLLTVQAARRAPRRVRAATARALRLGAGSGPNLRRAFADFVSDRLDDAAAELAAAPAPASRVGRRLAAELAVHLGHPDAIAGTVPPASTLARAAWKRGDVTEAIELVGHSDGGARFLARLISERATMEPGFRLQAPPAAGQWPAVPGHPRALHVLTNSVPHTHSGYAVRSHALLLGQQEAGIAVEAVTRIGYPVAVGLPLARDLDVVDGVRYHRVLPLRLATTPADRLQQMVDHVVRLAEEFRPTVLHTTTNYTNALVTEAAARALGLPWVYEVRGQLEKTWLAALPESGRAAGAESERYALLRAKETEMIRAADHVVTLSESLREDIRSRGVETVTVVPNAVDAALLDLVVEPAEARGRLGLPAAGFWVGTVSSLVDYEGLDTLLEAVAELRRSGLDVRVALVGDGVSRPSLEGLAARLGLGDAAVFPGRVDGERAALWHRALDAFVVPRRDLEVCRVVTPLKPIEAMAAGRPVVVSDLPALSEIVVAPGTGVAVPPGDVSELAEALASLYADPARRRAYGERGRAFAATRTWAANGRVYRKVYESLGESG